MRRFVPTFVTGLVFAGIAAPSLGIPVYGTNDPTNNSADYNFARLNPFALRVSLENTSNYDARITGFGFDIQSGLALALGSVTGTLNDGDWSFSFDGIPGPGDLDAFAITGSNVLGGNPNSGIQVDMTGVFDFLGLFGENLALSNVLIRWQRTGLNGEGSDIGYACARGCSPTQVPEPSTLSLFGIGLLLAGGVLSWKRRQPAV